jgi:hypothetical protein
MLKDQLPSESAIRQAVLFLKGQAGRLQEIAERFFEARERLKFRPIGRNNDGLATKGYPDAYAISPDGRMTVAEATAGDWRKHVLQEDLPRLEALGPGVVELYRLLVFRDEETPLPQKNARPSSARLSEGDVCSRIATACGIELSRVEIVFLKQLVRELRSPAHVPSLLALGQPVSPAPFQVVTDVSPSGIWEITPSPDEFDRDLVVPAESLEDLFRSLRHSDHVLLSGEGASGKTSLVLSAGRRWCKERGVALYLDLGNYELSAPGGAGELIDVGARFATGHSLFVLDNVHAVADGALATVLKAWRGLPEAPKVLSTGRGDLAAIRNAYGPRTVQLERRVTEADLLVAYRRLARRFWQTEDPPLPPKHVLREWRGFCNISSGVRTSSPSS